MILDRVAAAQESATKENGFRMSFVDINFDTSNDCIKWDFLHLQLSEDRCFGHSECVWGLSSLGCRVYAATSNNDIL